MSHRPPTLAGLRTVWITIASTPAVLLVGGLFMLPDAATDRIGTWFTLMVLAAGVIAIAVCGLLRVTRLSTTSASDAAGEFRMRVVVGCLVADIPATAGFVGALYGASVTALVFGTVSGLLAMLLVGPSVGLLDRHNRDLAARGATFTLQQGFPATETTDT